MLLLVIVSIIIFGHSFSIRSSSNVRRSSNVIKMEYIPDGLSKAQWAEMKKKEIESNKGKDLAKVGITKFQSRSLEAWQKSGQKNLFPVDPNTPTAEKPYMQRKGGSADGSDLAAKGIKGVGQAAAQKKIEADFKYEKLEKEGKLKSTPFLMPWSNEATAAIGQEKRDALKKEKEAFEKKKNSSIGAFKNPFQAAAPKKAPAPPPTPEPAPKKKLFGLF